MVDARMQMVTCASCKRTYRCTPTDDYYNNTTLDDGVCEPCLLKNAGFEQKDIDRAKDERPVVVGDTRLDVMARRPNKC